MFAYTCAIRGAVWTCDHSLEFQCVRVRVRVRVCVHVFFYFLTA